MARWVRLQWNDFANEISMIESLNFFLQDISKIGFQREAIRIKKIAIGDGQRPYLLQQGDHLKFLYIVNYARQIFACQDQLFACTERSILKYLDPDDIAEYLTASDFLGFEVIPWRDFIQIESSQSKKDSIVDLIASRSNRVKV